MAVKKQYHWFMWAMMALIYATSAIFTFMLLSEFVENPIIRVLTLIVYEGGLFAWGFVHHFLAENYDQHKLSLIAEWVSFIAVLSASVLYLFTLEERVYGLIVPSWVFSMTIPIVGAASFAFDIFCVFQWQKLSLAYQEQVATYKEKHTTGVDRVTVIEQKLDEVLQQNAQLLLPAPKDERSPQDKDDAVKEFLRTHDNASEREVALGTGIPFGSIHAIMERVKKQSAS
jgi:hypothetical protein